ncbi:MAG: hypothetical protein QM733_16815 [Ilumatobacteraceae bacterium]
MGGADPPELVAACRRSWWRRVSSVAVLVTMDLTIVALGRVGHRWTRIAESVLFPGIGFVEHHAWLRWGPCWRLSPSR